jgi:hypothetical protein
MSQQSPREKLRNNLALMDAAIKGSKAEQPPVKESAPAEAVEAKEIKEDKTQEIAPELSPEDKRFKQLVDTIISRSPSVSYDLLLMNGVVTRSFIVVPNNLTVAFRTVSEGQISDFTSRALALSTNNVSAIRNVSLANLAVSLYSINGELLSDVSLSDKTTKEQQEADFNKRWQYVLNLNSMLVDLYVSLQARFTEGCRESLFDSIKNG